MRVLVLRLLLTNSVLVTYSEWAVNHHRDSIASHIGHYDLLSFFAVVSCAQFCVASGFCVLKLWPQPCVCLGRKRGDWSCSFQYDGAHGTLFLLCLIASSDEKHWLPSRPVN